VVTLSGAATVNEGDTVNYSYTVTDPGADTFSLDAESCGTGNILSNSSFNPATGAGSFDCTFPDGPVSSNVSVTVTDDDGGSGTDSISVEVANVAPGVSVFQASQNVQYSDSIEDVTFTATDVAADTMTAATSYSVDGSGFTDGLPDQLALADDGCSDSDGTKTCTWTLSGIANIPAGVYTIRVAVTDKDGDQTDTEITITVHPEDIGIAFETNPVAVKVVVPGGESEPFVITTVFTEPYPADAGHLPYPGNIDLAEASMILKPVGPGGDVGPIAECDREVSRADDVGYDYDDILTVTCSFAGVPVNTYTAQVTVGGGYYEGSAEDVLVVYDPSLGFTTGGGWFNWPGTTEKTNFGYTMKYNKKGQKVKGSLLLIRHLPDGSIYRVKSNALFGLALGGSNFGWASFSGKNTYLEPGWEEPEGNHTFIVYVEDHGEPGTGADRFWIEVLDKDNLGIPVMSMTEPATANATTIMGGNVVVPHGGGGPKK
jgi:hypothetical protein